MAVSNPREGKREGFAADTWNLPALRLAADERKDAKDLRYGDQEVNDIRVKRRWLGFKT